ncbi:MAG: hypothetical protein OER86_13430, partial [Phycisphaerae bacterium]|nr:hypothetical protein [Phycisphaerae bacterium]
MKYGPCLLVLVASVAGAEPYDFEPIRYESTPARDPVSRLQERITAGKVKLRFDSTRGYLDALLAALDIPISSQGLVFSKTSFQPKHISPETPRAIYFSDDAYVGWVQGGDVIEISAVDPNLGAVFYTLDQRPQVAPKFVRRAEDCLQCHTSALAQSVPGHLVRSVYADADGHPLLRAGTSVSDHRTPLQRRWGGWYVTGTHGGQEHLGNVVFFSGAESGIPEPKGAQGSNLVNLEGRFETAPYLSPKSDIVARMVLDHQAHMHNLITRAAYRTRIALHETDSFGDSKQQ